MTEPGRRLQITPAWLAIILSMVASVISLLYQIAVTSASVSQNTRRVDILEAADRTRGNALGRIDSRTARIEATLEMMFRQQPYRPMSAPLPAAEPHEAPADEDAQ